MRRGRRVRLHRPPAPCTWLQWARSQRRRVYQFGFIRLGLASWCVCEKEEGGAAHVSSSGGETGHCPSCIIHARHVRPWGLRGRVCEQHETTWVHIVSALSPVLRDPNWYPAASKPWPAGRKRQSRSYLGLPRKPVYSGSNEDWWHAEFRCQYNRWSSPLLTHDSPPSAWARERSWSELWDLSRSGSL